MDANLIKATLIDHLILESDHKSPVIGIEIPFNDGRRKADVVAITNQMIAYEIKSDRDRIDTIIEQVNDYRKCFEVVYVVSGPTHTSLLKSTLPKPIGIVQVTKSQISYIRSAQVRKTLNRLEVVKLLTRKELEQVALQAGFKYANGKKLTTTRLQKVVADKLPQAQLLEMARNILKERLQTRFRHFIEHRGDVTHTEDLYFFTSAPDQIDCD